MYKKIKLDQINISLNFYKGKRKTFFQKRKFSQIKKYKTFSQEKNCTFVRNFCYNYYDQIESIKKVRKDKQSANYIFVHEKDEVKEQIVSSSER